LTLDPNMIGAKLDPQRLGEADHPHFAAA
jgi:hypothetical protein